MDEDGPESDELSDCAGHEIRCECAWFFPVAETDSVVGWSSAEVDYDGEDDEADYRDDLDGTEPELAFSEELHGEKVQRGDADPGNDDAVGDVEVGRPVLNDQSGGSKFEGEGHGPGEPVDPTHCEAERGINKSRCVGGECSRDGNVSCHLSEGDHNTVHECSYEGVGNKCTGWT